MRPAGWTTFLPCSSSLYSKTRLNANSLSPAMSCALLLASRTERWRFGQLPVKVNQVQRAVAGRAKATRGNRQHLHKASDRTKQVRCPCSRSNAYALWRWLTAVALSRERQRADLREERARPRASVRSHLGMLPPRTECQSGWCQCPVAQPVSEWAECFLLEQGDQGQGRSAPFTMASCRFGVKRLAWRKRRTDSRPTASRWRTASPHIY